MADLYEPLVGFNLWIRRDGEEKAELNFVTKELILPKSKKVYKLTLKNLKVYIEELMILDSTISEIQIDRINSVGIIKR